MVQEFQVIIFAGGAGNRMYPLTEGIPKNMLSVSNRPLISYQLELLERVGISGMNEILSDPLLLHLCTMNIIYHTVLKTTLQKIFLAITL